MTDPAFWTALTTALGIAATLAKVIQGEREHQKTAVKVDTVVEQTNGILAKLVSENAALRATQATEAELAARAHTPPALEATP